MVVWRSRFECNQPDLSKEGYGGEEWMIRYKFILSQSFVL